MNNQTLTLTIPAPLYQRLKNRAEQAQRPVEEEALVVLAAGVPVADELPAEFVQVLADLTRQPDDFLWQAARERLSSAAATEMEQLHLKQQREGLSPAETQELVKLVGQYERTMLVRAQAAALLRQRGHDISTLKTTP